MEFFPYFSAHLSMFHHQIDPVFPLSISKSVVPQSRSLLFTILKTIKENCFNRSNQTSLLEGHFRHTDAAIYKSNQKSFLFFWLIHRIQCNERFAELGRIENFACLKKYQLARVSFGKKHQSCRHFPNFPKSILTPLWYLKCSKKDNWLV